jgi:hypothetical protein
LEDTAFLFVVAGFFHYDISGVPYSCPAAARDEIPTRGISAGAPGSKALKGRVVGWVEALASIPIIVRATIDGHRTTPPIQLKRASLNSCHFEPGFIG